ncbi:AAA family ATPase [Pleomorphomonas sp. JP5]|uniref:AAA family ATPase n=1 Tax=Pleomorphomonas sp. JP5 TaxID=2942998 RepID=UPI0020435482|nr:AAA family ATPase [Pleomorphomonas sp. JP5]MCM5557497.1 AAA family ATPase [Pleomorphomonas sp. JP5]
MKHDLGGVRVGFVGQTSDTTTYSVLGSGFGGLDDRFFSLGTDLDYYVKVNSFSDSFKNEYLKAIRDVAFLQDALDIANKQHVFHTSHLRSLSINTITGQFRRVLHGEAPLTDYAFRFTQEASESVAGFQLTFNVSANSKPATNVHAVIGRNGVGKTTLLHNMTRAIIDAGLTDSRFEKIAWLEYARIGRDYFSGLVSISFSAFDPFKPPMEQPDPSQGTCYFYVGLKDYSDEAGASLKSQHDLLRELIESLEICLSERSRSQRWLEAIRNLESDDNFAEMNLGQLSNLRDEELRRNVCSLWKRMSSGHAIVLLIITKLVARVDEKTLVLFDEPESHLHPPLLSALIRSLSGLLSSRNAIAIIATHSPVVLQEIPCSCVWKITRSGLSSLSQRPEIETFGENVGLLTREVFGLEVAKSGFNSLLEGEAERTPTYEEVLQTFSHQLGSEGRAILRAIMHRKSTAQ